MTSSGVTSEETSTEVEVVEEDWSHFMTTNAVHTDETNHAATEGLPEEEDFPYYDTMIIPLIKECHCDGTGNKSVSSLSQLPALSIEIRCMESLTPLDMLDLSSGRSDPTGNRIWMGAVFFLECMARPIEIRPPHLFNKHIRALIDLRATLFHNKNVLELGSGTGVGLIAVGLAGTRNSTITIDDEHWISNANSGIEGPICPASLTFTDNDLSVLSLCKSNCNKNLLKDCGAPLVEHVVAKLDWGEFSGLTKSQKSKGPFLWDATVARGALETVVATDVIYDVSAIPLLMATAVGLLKEGGFFVLAHVPRASISCEASQIRESLEGLILLEAQSNGLEAPISMAAWECLFTAETTDNGDSLEPHGAHQAIIRPSILAQVWENNLGVDTKNNPANKRKTAVVSVSSDYDYGELESCGASIMVFQKKAGSLPTEDR